MTQCVIGVLIAIVLLTDAMPGWSQQFYLYAPKPVAAGEKIQKNDSILVQEVTVKKGDTLSGLSRIFNGHGSYYSQILLFNDIKDPNKIYIGNILKIPVSRREMKDKVADVQAQRSLSSIPPSGPVPESSAGDLKKGGAGEIKKRDLKQITAVPAHAPVKAAHKASIAVDDSSEQKLYERAIKAYRQDDCRTALELFDRFLSDYPLSALAADANLYKAECYLKQSNQ
jgi:LysM repeat protein